MNTLLMYVRSLLGWGDKDTDIRLNVKRQRSEYDDYPSDDESPKRLKQMNKTIFPEVMSSKDLLEEKRLKNIRYVPIEVEDGHPSTSTPYESINKENRIRTVPIKLVGRQNGSLTPMRKPRVHTPVAPVMRAVVLDDDDDDNEVTLVEAKPEKTKIPTKLYVNLDDEANDDDVVFVKKISTPPPRAPYKFFLSKNNDVTDFVGSDGAKYKLYEKVNERKSSLSPRSYSVLRHNTGITKSYKRTPNVSLPNWVKERSSSNPRFKNYYNLNGNTDATISKLFNIQAKNDYMELIKNHASDKPIPSKKLIDIVNLADDSASFRLTKKTQKSSLNEILRLEKDLKNSKDNEATREYDPITVASINSSDSEVDIIQSDTSTVSSIRIEPVNTLRDSFKDKSVTSSDWLKNIDAKYRKLKKDNQEKLKDVRRESDIISKVNHEQSLARLRTKLKYDLVLAESLIEEEQPTVELPPLTAEQEKLVNKALGPGPPGQVFIEKFNLRITRRDLQTLHDLNWLNDEVINFYMNLLMQRCEERKDLPKVYATNTFFYPKLMQSGQPGLRRWTRKVDIFAHDIMVAPIHLGVHWCMSLIDFRKKKISYLDSMGGRNQAALDALLKYLKDEHQDKKGQPFDDAGWKTENLKDIPQQMNGSDCGMFACTFAEFTCRDAPYTFTQANMPYLRKKAALEIIQGKLLL
ncbi:sentrin-specific protease-like isoform X2 [Zerene cesonia]|uniref:sentrin-specific protease-like isoform X2 n=1 Tax=Zerene cesonia TaxID=33412 RepID=UPI0018E59002|nr:sentrin-specific protease-like isoform X2 [Zerene cesonia]